MGGERVPVQGLGSMQGNAATSQTVEEAGNKGIPVVRSDGCSTRGSACDLSLGDVGVANYVVRFNMTCAFPLESFRPQVERFHKFLGFVDASLLRFCKLKFPMQKLRLSIGPLDVIGSSFFLDKWIGLAVENELLNMKLRNRDAKCCNSQTIKCWQHYLKDAEIYCFQPDGDEEPYDIDDQSKELPELPLGDLYFRLD
ncbi:hypothetical protein LWI29_020802 [Acer saccharum]|uniref:Uncharacterized protein n=1 Tax=Acer saccharum TaxID=4024 RepID=A0AA39SMT6_ACESA|nr:hypothetical protein LWI29_020802 [Acer saccharum]